LTHTANEPVV